MMLSPRTLNALESKLTIRRNSANSSSSASANPASWRREELWKISPGSAMADVDVPFVYSFDDTTSLPPLTVAENHDEVGTRVWDASLILCKMFEFRAKLLTELWTGGRVIVELGAGTGIASAVLARLLSMAPESASSVGASGPVAPTKIFAADTAPVVRHMATVFGSNGLLSAPSSASPLSSSSQAIVLKPQVLVWDNKEHIEALHSAMDSGKVDVIIACDMAAPTKFVPDFLATVQALMPPRPRSGEDSGETEGTSRDLASLLAPPCILIVSQKHRDFTSPMLEGLRALYPEVTELTPQAGFLHPDFLSEERHSVHVLWP